MAGSNGIVHRKGSKDANTLSGINNRTTILRKLQKLTEYNEMKDDSVTMHVAWSGPLTSRRALVCIWYVL